MVPVVVDNALEKVAGRVIRLLVIEIMDLLKFLGGERIEERIGELRNGLPGLPHLGKRWCAGRLTITDQFVDMGQPRFSLQACKPVTLLLSGQVADIPADAVHGQ